MTAVVVLAAAKGGKDMQAGLAAAAGATLQAATSSATQADAAALVKGQSWIDAAKTALSAVQRSRLAAWSVSVPLAPRNEILSIWKQEIKLREAMPAKRHGRGQTQICASAGSEISVLLFVQRRKSFIRWRRPRLLELPPRPRLQSLVPRRRRRRRPHPRREPPPHLRRQLIQKTPPAPRPAQPRQRYPPVRGSVCQQLCAPPPIPQRPPQARRPPRGGVGGGGGAAGVVLGRGEGAAAGDALPAAAVAVEDAPHQPRQQHRLPADPSAAGALLSAAAAAALVAAAPAAASFAIAAVFDPGLGFRSFACAASRARGEWMGGEGGELGYRWWWQQRPLRSKTSPTALAALAPSRLVCSRHFLLLSAVYPYSVDISPNALIQTRAQSAKRKRGRNDNRRYESLDSYVGRITGQKRGQRWQEGMQRMRLTFL